MNEQDDSHYGGYGMKINNKCVYCENTGYVWKGGQGGDYEFCECEVGKKKKEENK